jgi:hypothetical protein
MKAQWKLLPSKGFAATARVKKQVFAAVHLLMNHLPAAIRGID